MYVIFELNYFCPKKYSEMIGLVSDRENEINFE